jgi:hypothetical protein
MDQFTLPDEAIPDMAILRDIGVKKLENLIAQFQKIEPTPLHPVHLVDAVYQTLGEDEKVAESIFRLLFSLYEVRRLHSLSQDDVLKGLQFQINKSNWSKQEIDKWQSIQPQLEKLLDLENIWTVSKALDLAYEYHDLYQRARIITDIRPVFTQNGLSIQGCIVTHTLQITFVDDNGTHDTYILIDESDIDQLMRACERAKIKSQTVKRLIETMKVPVHVIGEDEDGAN